MDNRCDLLLRGGTVVDGGGEPGRLADVAVAGDRIAEVGDLSGRRADRVLEVEGLVVAPGFIDMHSHSDLSLLINGRAESKIRQGVTTEVIGQCGFSPAPATTERSNELRAMFGFLGHQVEWSWGSFGEYLSALREKGTSVNVVPLVGHSTLRTGFMGQQDRAPTAAELAAMQEAAAAAMEEGAFGLSTGLVYVPGVFADTDEVIALARTAAGRSGLYFSHIRGEHEALLKAVSEAIRIGREAGCPVQIAHLKAEGRANWGKVEQALAAIGEARGDGLDVTFDVYPYTAWNTGLAQLLPAWAREGGSEAMVARLQEPAARARIRAEVAAEAAADPGRWGRRLISWVDGEQNRGLQGMTLEKIAGRRGVPAEDAVMDLLVEERGNVSMVGFGMCEDDVRRALTHEAGMIGSDAAATAPYGELGRGHPHPRTYGTFARVLGHYVREERLLSLEEAVAKMTGRPARKLRLDDRGRIALGCAADIVVFDPDAIADQASYESPHQYPIGIHWVVVNGVVEVEGDVHHDRRPGRVLSRPA